MAVGYNYTVLVKALTICIDLEGGGPLGHPKIYINLVCL